MNLLSKDKIKRKYVITGITIMILVISFINRLVRGVDTTDESFYATLAYSLCNGRLLFVDMWEQCSTSAVFPAALLNVFIRIRGGVDGCILFFRIAYFVCNIILACFVTYVLSHLMETTYAMLVSAIFLFYAPFHHYNLSYNHQADFLMLACEMLLLYAALNVRKKNIRYAYLAAGITCALLAFVYPPMIILCPAMVLLVLLNKKTTGSGFLWFLTGGLIAATFILLLLQLTIGAEGVLYGIKGILSDPTYGATSERIVEKVLKAFSHLFVVVSEESKLPMKLYAILIGISIYFKERIPRMKLVTIGYPVVAWMQMYPSSSLATYAAGTYAFYLAVFAPIMLFFVEKNKDKYKKLLFYVWIPSFMMYTVFGVSSAGGPNQGSQGLVAGGMVSMIGIIYVILEQQKDRKKEALFQNICIPCVITMTLILEIAVFYSVVYRDSNVPELTSKIEYGPYQGLYTSYERKKYLESMTDIMRTMDEVRGGEREKACVLYHSNFAYLMLQAAPATPSTWGIYPGISNESVFLKYYRTKEDHIPDAIYVVDVPDEWNFDYQSEEYYDFCNDIKSLIGDYYVLKDHVVINKTGKVDKYVRTAKKSAIFEELRRYDADYFWGEGFYGEERNDSTIFSWCGEEGSIHLPNETEESVSVHIEFVVVAPQAEIGKNSVSYQLNDIENTKIFERVDEKISIDTTLKPGDNILSISSDTPQYEVEEDSRDLYFYVAHIEISETEK